MVVFMLGFVMLLAAIVIVYVDGGAVADAAYRRVWLRTHSRKGYVTVLLISVAPFASDKAGHHANVPASPM
jgi:hypothetical protein